MSHPQGGPGPTRNASAVVAHDADGFVALLSAYFPDHGGDYLRDFTPRVPDRAWPTAAALAVTVGLHVWRRNVTLSVAAGTAVYALLASTAFVPGNTGWFT
nr:AzlD domain-containing protein [Streptomyces sp. NBC_00899]